MTDVPETMRAAYIERHGPADEIVYGTLPVPRPARGEVLVRVEAAAVNPVDTIVRAGAYRTPLPWPFVVGRDLVGMVAANGAGAGYPIGRRVWANSLGHGGRQGVTAEYACVATDRLYALPDGVDPLRAVAAAHPAGTAHTGLVHHVGGVRPGSVVLVGGGAGNVGICVVRLAASMGARIIATAHGAEDTGWCRRWGAAVVVDHRRDDLADQVRAAAPDGVDLHFDTSGAGDLGTAVELLAQGGTIVLMAGYGRRLELPAGAFYTRDARIVGFAISNATAAELDRAAADINRLLAEGMLPVRIAEVLPMSRTADAHRMVEGKSGKTPKGRVVIRVAA